MSQKDTTWPVPKFYFSVNIYGNEFFFNEVSGLDTGTSTAPPTTPGLKHKHNIVLKKGVFQDRTIFLQLYSKLTQPDMTPATFVIRLLDEHLLPEKVWTLQNAYLHSISGTDLKSEENEVAVESIDIAYETMVISTP